MKKFVLEIFLILSFIFSIFGLLIIRSGIQSLRAIPDLVPSKVKLDRINRSDVDIAYPIVTGYFTIENEKYSVPLSSDGAKYQNYILKDSIVVWYVPGENRAYIKEINPTKKALYNRYFKQVFLIGGACICPFLIILIIYIRLLKKHKL